jgi:membrane-associated phospholipid phosphatase
MQNATQGVRTATTTVTAGGENRQVAQKRHFIEIVLWLLGFMLFLASCVVIHAHPMPYSFDLAATETEQHIHYAPWLLAFINFPSVLNNPLPSEVALGLWLVFLVVVAVIRHIRKLPALGWIQAAVGLVIAVMASSLLNVLIDEIVARPRPNQHTEPIHIYTPIVPFPTYPSGHTEHDMVYYGFLLYLSFTKPVREWKYAWMLIPLQIFAAYNIILIGYSRIYLGDHWLTDVLGGYLEGILELYLFIALYRLATDLLAKWRAKRMQKVSFSHH